MFTTTAAVSSPDLLNTPDPLPDDLGKLLDEAVTLYLSSNSWEQFVGRIRVASDLSPTVGTLPHPAAPLLHNL